MAHQDHARAASRDQAALQRAWAPARGLSIGLAPDRTHVPDGHVLDVLAGVFMQAIGGFPIDLVMFAMIAAFLVLRLRSILGKRSGFEGSPVAPPKVGNKVAQVIDGKAEPVPAARPLPQADSTAGQALAAMQAADRRFDPRTFITGAEAAFRIIVTAFGAGDRTRLRPLLGDSTYAAFGAAITAREAASETQHTEVRDILEAEIRDAALDGKLASITMHFVSRQVNFTVSADGTTVGGTDAVTEIADLWTFTRVLDQADPAWRLTEAKAA
jgi:predicted lipid-binding transport protein (Tim44 family)